MHPGNFLTRWWPLVLRVLVAGMCFCGLARAATEAADYLVDGWDTENNLPSSTVTSIAQTPDGYLWVGTYNGLARFDGARFVTFDPVNQPELTQTRVQGLFLDANGTLWINTFRGGLTSYRAGVFRKEFGDQNAYDQHTTLVASTSNRVTFVTQAGEVLQRNSTRTNGVWNVVMPTAASRPIFHCADAAGTLWFLTREGHILRFAEGVFKELPEDGGLAGSQIYSLVADAHGEVWAGLTTARFSAARRKNWSRSARRMREPGNVERLPRWFHEDGGLRRLQPTRRSAALECSDSYQPASWRGPDGQLWFTTVRGVVWLNPDELTARSTPPPVLVEELRVDGELMPLREGQIIVPPGHHQFDFRFTALSFDAGDQARFRYRLEGFDAT